MHITHEWDDHTIYEYYTITDARDYFVELFMRNEGDGIFPVG